MLTPLRRIFPTDGAVTDLTAEYPWPEGRWVRASMVSTVDGAGAGPDGRSGSISTPADFELFKALRNDCDVIVVGAGTARHERYRPPRSARLAVVTRSALLDPSLPFLADADQSVPPIVITCTSADARALADVATLADVIIAGDDEVDLAEALAELHERGLSRMVVEGGPSLLADLVDTGLVDELDVQVTPLLAGGGATRMLAGTAAADPPHPLQLLQVITDGETLFLRYARGGSVRTRHGS